MTAGRRCPEKVRHRDRVAALLALASVRRRGRDPGAWRAYPCALCGGWHLTSQKRDSPGVGKEEG